MFKGRGIDPVRDFKQILYSGSHEATILAMLSGKVAAGATYANSPDSSNTARMRYLKNSEDVQKIRAIPFSQPPSSPIILRSAPILDEALAKKIEATFIELSRMRRERKCFASFIRSTASFPPTDKDYDPLRSAFADKELI